MTTVTIDTAISHGVVVYTQRRDRGCDLAGRGWLVHELEGGIAGMGDDGAGQRGRRSTPRFPAASSSIYIGGIGDAISGEGDGWFVNWKGGIAGMGR
jgi:hypothetical protein